MVCRCSRSVYEIGGGVEEGPLKKPGERKRFMTLKNVLFMPRRDSHPVSLNAHTPSTSYQTSTISPAELEFSEMRRACETKVVGGLTLSACISLTFRLRYIACASSRLRSANVFFSSCPPFPAVLFACLADKAL